MNNTDLLNEWGRQAVAFCWPMLWQSSLLIVVLLVLDFALARRVRAAVRYALWLVVLVKLVLPPSLALPTSVAWWVRDTTPAPMAQKRTPVVVTQGPGRIIALPAPVMEAITVEVREPISPAGWGLVASGCASLLLVGLMLNQWRQVVRETRAGAPPPDWVNEMLQDTRKDTGLRRPVRLRVIDRAVSPAVCGFLQPVILMPRALIDQFAPEHLRAILMHELMHLRRGDVWMNGVQALLQVVYWWHPLLWLANARIRRTREEAVDDAVMHSLKQAADTYAPTLLKVAKLALQRPMVSLGLVGILESRSSLGRRIEKLVSAIPPRKPRLTITSALCVFGFCAMALPMGPAPAPRVGAETPPATDAATSKPASDEEERVQATALVQEAKDLYQQGRLAEAKETLMEALRHDRKNSLTDFFLGLVRTNTTTGEATGKPPESEQLHVRRFKVDPNTFKQSLEELSGKRFSTTNPTVIHEVFESAGVRLNPPKSMVWNDREGTLIVRASAKDLDLIEEAIQVIIRVTYITPALVNIRARFFAIPEEMAASTWKLGGGTDQMGLSASNSTEVLTEPQARVLLKALESTPDVDALNEGAITTLSGRQCEISLVDAHPMHLMATDINPQALKPPGISTNEQGKLDLYTPSQAWLGPTLNVIPYVAADGLKIQLTVVASLTEFLGYDSPTNQVTVYIEGKPTPVAVPRPRLKRREQSTSAIIWDGQTLLLGNPLAEATPKDEPSGIKSKRVFVMVTPTIVDPAGNRVNGELGTMPK